MTTKTVGLYCGADTIIKDPATSTHCRKPSD